MGRGGAFGLSERLEERSPGVGHRCVPLAASAGCRSVLSRVGSRLQASLFSGALCFVFILLVAVN